MFRNVIPQQIRHFMITTWHKFKYKLIIGKNSYISHCNFEKNCAIGENCKVTNSIIGKYTYITEGARISHAKIGKFCSIGPNLRIGMASHPIKKFVSTSPIFYLKYTNLKNSFTKIDKIETHKFTDKSKYFFVEIGNDVWIGANVNILDGVKIGHGAIIGANSLVTKNIPPYSVAFGVPAKIIKLRFAKSQIKKLLVLKWWNQDDQWIIRNANLLDDINNFLKKYKFN
jgi:acetyltransferase-like isoleucine patch superfamily enzyme